MYSFGTSLSINRKQNDKLNYQLSETALRSVSRTSRLPCCWPVPNAHHWFHELQD